MWGVRGRTLSHSRLPAFWAGCRGPLPTGCGCGGVRAWGPVTNPTARALASWLCAPWERHEGARGGRLLPECGASRVVRSPSPDCPPSERAAGAHYPLAVGAGGCGRGDPSPTPQRAFLRACFVRCGGGKRAPWGGRFLPACGASGVGRSPTPDCPPSGRAAGAHYPLAVGAGGVRAWGPVTNPTARALASWVCVLWGRHEGARGGAPPAWVWGVQGRALSHPRLPALRAGCRGPIPTGCGCGGVRAGDPSPTPQRALLRAGFARCGGSTRATGGGASFLGVGRPGSGASPPPTVRPLGGLLGPTTHGLWVPGGAGVGTRHQLHSALSCVLWGRHEGARGGRLWPWCGASRVGHSPTPDCPPSGRAAGAHYPLAVGAGGVRARGPVTNPTACAIASWLCALLGRHEGARGGRPLPGCGASGVGRSPIPDSPSFRACGRGALPSCRGCGVRAWGSGCPWHLVPCRGSLCVVHASRVRGTRWPLWLGTCPRAVVVAGGVPLWRASWPRVAAPLLVRSRRSRCSGWLSRRRGAFPHPGGCRPRPYWVAVRGTWNPAGNGAPCACRWPLPRQGRWVRSLSYPFRAPGWGCPWRIPPASVLGCVRCGGLACVDPVTDASGFPYRPSCDGGLSRCTGAVSCGRRHRPFRVGERHAWVPRVCACASPAWPGRAGRPPGRLLVRLPFSLGVLGSLFACSAPFRLGLPCLWLLLGLFFFLFLFPFSPSLRPRSVLLCVFPGPGCLGPWRLVPPPLSPPPLPLCAPLSAALRVFRPGVPWALASCCPPLFFSCPPALLLSLAFPAFWLPWASAPPSPLFFIFFYSLVSCFVFFRLFLSLLFLPVVRCGAGLCVLGRQACLGGAVPVVALCALAGVVWCWLLGRAVLCCLLVGLGVVLWWCCPCLAAWLAALWFGVVCLGVPLPCVVFCCAVLSCGGVLSCSAVCLRRRLCLLFVSCRCASAVCVLGCRAVCSLSCPFVVLCASSVLFLVAGVVGSWCRCLLLGVRWWLWLPRVVVWWCVSALVPVSGLAVAERLPCGVLFPCAVSCGAVLPCGAVLWCPVFVLCFSPCWWRWFPVVPRWFWAPGRFRVVSVSVLCLCGAVLVYLRRCSLFGALLPSRGWLVFCVVACFVSVFAVGPGCPLLSPGGSWWLLVSCLGGVLWCAPGCCAAPCCCALCRLALHCCALCCFVLLCLVLPRAVLCPGALSVVLGSCAFWRRVLSCPQAKIIAPHDWVNPPTMDNLCPVLAIHQIRALAAGQVSPPSTRRRKHEQHMQPS